MSCQFQRWWYRFTYSLWKLTCYLPIDTKTILTCYRSLGPKDWFSIRYQLPSTGRWHREGSGWTRGTEDSVFPWDLGVAGGPGSPAGSVMSEQQEDWYSASLQQLFYRNTIKAHCVYQATGCNYICLPAAADLRQKTVFVVSSHCIAYLRERGCLPSVRQCLSFLSSEVRLNNYSNWNLYTVPHSCNTPIHRA